MARALQGVAQHVRTYLVTLNSAAFFCQDGMNTHRIVRCTQVRLKRRKATEVGGEAPALCFIVLDCRWRETLGRIVGEKTLVLPVLPSKVFFLRGQTHNRTQNCYLNFTDLQMCNRLEECKDSTNTRTASFHHSRGESGSQTFVKSIWKNS